VYIANEFSEFSNLPGAVSELTGCLPDDAPTHIIKFTVSTDNDPIATYLPEAGGSFILVRSGNIQLCASSSHSASSFNLSRLLKIKIIIPISFHPVSFVSG
jgi:hypothetical protein